MLSSYSSHQIEMAVAASLLQLDLLFPKQINEYADNLLTSGYYDDSLLEILDEDPIYPNVAKAYALRTAMTNLGFPIVSNEQARWILVAHYIYAFSVRPHNYNIFEFNDLYDYFFFNDPLDSATNQKIDAFKYLLYRIDDATPLPDGYVQKGFNDAKTLFKLQTDFFIMGEYWLTDQHLKIEAIFSELYA